MGYQRGGGRFVKAFLLYNLLTLGNCGISGASVARAARTTAVGVPAGLQVIRDTKVAKMAKMAKVKNFILARLLYMSISYINFRYVRVS